MKRLLSILFLITLATPVAAEGWFLKLPYASHHWGKLSHTVTQEVNLGIGLGYNLAKDGVWQQAVSVTAFQDSFNCQAGVVQYRVTRQFDWLGLGGSLNAAHKCTDTGRPARTIVAPMASFTVKVTQNVTLAVDLAPSVPKVSPIGFAAFSLEWGF